MFGKSLLVRVILVLWFLFALPSSVLAVVIVIKAHPQQVQTLEEFEIVADAVELEGSTVFHAKASGGDDFSEVQTYSPKTNTFLNYSGSSGMWADHPEFTSNASGSATFTLKARFKEGAKTGSSQLKITLRRKGSNSNLADSTVNITVNPGPTSTLTPSKTPTPTHSPTPTKTPPPTPPSKTPTPKQTVTALNTSGNQLVASQQQSSNQESIPQVLGSDSDTQPTLTPQPSPKQNSVLVSGSKISLVLGLLFLGTGIMIFAQKWESKKHSPSK